MVPPMAYRFDVGHRRETLVAMARAILPHHLPESVATAVVDDLMAEVGLSPEDKQRALGGLVDVFDRSFVVRALGGGFAPLRALPGEAVERVLGRLATHPVPQLRAGFTAIRKGITF